MRLSGITPESYVDGPGLRFVIFAQGCPHHCPHCHNPESWSPDAGQDFTVKDIIRRLRRQKKKFRGLTLSGGEPFLQAAELAEVAQAARRMGWDVVTYTGFLYEQLDQDPDEHRRALLSASDILIDGQYMHNLCDIALSFRGSSNQRIIDVAASQQQGKAVLWENIEQ